MKMYTIKSGNYAAMITEHGAELRELIDCKTGQNYMWNADPKSWQRVSPILFPFVGNCKNKETRYEGHVYSVSQHGFARDMDFSPFSRKQDEVWFSLESNEETLKKYPFPFRLEIGYRLQGNQLKITWRVINTGKDTMYFSIGGHPGFVCPLLKDEKRSDYYLHFDTDKEVISRMIGEDGLASDMLLTYPLEDGYLSIADDLFDHDALVIENHQVQEVSICTPDKKPYVTVSFDAPLFGVWSVPHMDAPFVCIEPWYGRCDHTSFKGTLQEREWGNVLAAGETFETAYTIKIHE